jgi:hypothetical protein
METTFHLSLPSFASLADVVRRLPEGRGGDLSAIVWAYGTKEEVCFACNFGFAFLAPFSRLFTDF